MKYVVGDLHLSEGENEDFFYDKEFANFLKTIKGTLIVNGDLIDFLQVTHLGKFKGLSSHEESFGLSTSAEHSVYKLERVMKAHKVLFKALANFVNQGNKLVILRGNHDPEFFWPGVQKAFVDILKKNFKLKKEKGIKFNLWFYLDKDTYVEHGHQYDGYNSFHYWLYPVLPYDREKINLAFGGFTVRYFFNKVEKIDPMVDNIKPGRRYLRWSLRKHFFKAVGTFGFYFSFLARSWRKHIEDFEQAEWDYVQSKHIGARERLGKKFKLSEVVMERLDKLKAKPVMEKKIFLKALIETEWKDFEKVAQKIQNLLGVRNVVFGHSHLARKFKLREGYYLNCGTWTPFDLNKKKLVKRLTYIRIGRGQAKLLEWK